MPALTDAGLVMTGPWPQRQFMEDTKSVGKASICTAIEEGHMRNHRK